MKASAESDICFKPETNESEFLNIIQEPGPRDIEISEYVIVPMPESVLKPTLDTLCQKLNIALLKYGKYVVWSEKGEIRTTFGDDIIDVKKRNPTEQKQDPKVCSIIFQGHKLSRGAEDSRRFGNADKWLKKKLREPEKLPRKFLYKTPSTQSVFIQVVNKKNATRKNMYRLVDDPTCPSILIEVTPPRESSAIYEEEEEEFEQEHQFHERYYERVRFNERTETNITDDYTSEESKDETEEEIPEGEREEKRSKQLEYEEWEDEGIESKYERVDAYMEEKGEMQLSSETQKSTETTQSTLISTDSEIGRGIKFGKTTSLASVVVQIVDRKSSEIPLKEKQTILHAIKEAIQESDVVISKIELPYDIKCKERVRKYRHKQMKRFLHEFQQMEDNAPCALDALIFRRRFINVRNMSTRTIPLLSRNDENNLIELRNYISKMLPTYIENQVPEVVLLLATEEKEVNPEWLQVRTWMEKFKVSKH